jgi:hypothetical protein
MFSQQYREDVCQNLACSQICLNLHVGVATLVVKDQWRTWIPLFSYLGQLGEAAPFAPIPIYFGH